MDKNRKKFMVIAILLVTIIFTGCSPREGVNKKVDNDRIKIVTSLYPQYEFAKKVGGEKVDVKLLLPSGVEAHSYEPTPRDIVAIKNADIFAYTNIYMEAWVGGIVKNLKDTCLPLDLSEGIVLSDGDLDRDNHVHDDDDDSHSHKDENHIEEDDLPEDDHHGHSHEKDPHIWTSPVNAIKMVENIRDGLIQVDGENSSYYRKNAEEYIEDLKKLDEDIFKEIGNENLKIVFGGHFAFGYFAERYNLEYISPYKGFSPDGEPSARNIVNMIKEIKKDNIEIIYHEELIDPKIARILAEETDSRLLMLHSIHNLTKEEIRANKGYISIMYENLENLKEAKK